MSEKPVPLDFSHHFSRATKKRVPNNLKANYKYFLIPGIGNLAGGLPHPNYFPYDTLEANTALPDRFKPTPNDPVDPPTNSLKKLSVSENKQPAASRILVPHDSADKNILRKIDVASALQYGLAQGYSPLYGWLRAFTTEVFHPNIPYKDGPEIILDNGTTDGMSKVLELFFNHWDRDRDWIREREGLIVEEFAYSAPIAQSKPRDINIVPIAMDDEGMLAFGKGGLQDVMENWDFSKGKRPHVMYTVTMGQNPTSGLLSLTRRKELYQICSKYDIIIVEDDPYWYLQYPSANAMSAKYRGQPISQNFPTSEYNYNNPVEGKKSSGYKFMDSLVPSYLNIDTDGRVVRLDTFSKTVAPGCRLGWITASPSIIEKLYLITEAQTSQPSGFVQSMIAELLVGPYTPSSDEGKGGGKDGAGWKADGWVRWLEGLRGNYERRMNAMAKILEENKYYVGALSQQAREPTKHTRSLSEDESYEIVSKTLMYDFVWPMAGMFLWMELKFESHPLFKQVEKKRLARALFILLTQEPYLVLIMPGSAFAASPEIAEEKGWKCVRLCFAAIDEDKLEPYMQGFVDACKHFWSLRKVEDINHILRDDDDEAKEGGGDTLDTMLKTANLLEENEDLGIQGKACMTHFC